MALTLTPSNDPASETVILVLRASEGANPEILKGLTVEVTKAPFHKKMKIDEGVQMSRGDAAWHLAKSKSWDPRTLPVEFEIMSVADAQNEAKNGKAGLGGANDQTPTESALRGMKKDELVAFVVEQGKATAEEAAELTKDALVALFYPE